MDGSKSRKIVKTKNSLKHEKNSLKQEKKSRELLYVKLEQKFEMGKDEIRDHHQNFLVQNPGGEMNREDFINYAEKEKQIKTVVAESLFRYKTNILLLLHFPRFYQYNLIPNI